MKISKVTITIASTLASVILLAFQRYFSVYCFFKIVVI